MEHTLERQIILKLIHAPSLGFNELWEKNGESNTFAYHVNKLVEQGLVSKEESKYSLTAEGRKLSAFIEGDTGEKAKFPTFAHCLIIWGDDGRVLCQKRLKEPYYGAWGFVSGKINFGQNLLECASRDLVEETGLVGKEFRAIGMEQIKTYDKGELLHHHYLYCIHVRDVSGELRAKTHKAEHAWFLPEEYRAKRSFPETWPYKRLFWPSGYVHIEAERHMVDGKFISGKVVSLTELGN